MRPHHLLPFHNIVGDPEQEYVADGMMDDIITGAVAVCDRLRQRVRRSVVKSGTD